MADYILIVDDSNIIKSRIDAAFQNDQVTVIAFNDVNSAKRKLVQDIPSIIISVIKLGGDDRAGCKFAKDLYDHSEYTKLPVILICDVLTPELLKSAKEVGAKALYAADVEDGELIHAIKLLAPELSSDKKPEGKGVTCQQPESDALNDDNLAYAHSLLTLSLHTIKTSGLLDVIDRHGVSAVVSAVTAAICRVETDKNN